MTVTGSAAQVRQLDGHVDLLCNDLRAANRTGEDAPVRLLVIEDELGVALGLATALTREGFVVDVEEDGERGLAAALAHTYDLIILDILLPGLNGYRVCAALRSSGNWTPVLMLTAKDGEHDEAEGLDTGADDYLTKPFHMVVLTARVRALLRRPRSSGDAPFTVGDLRLDPVRHRCWRGEVEVLLTARERDLLTQLMVHAGETLSKAQLLDNVWGDEFDGDPNIVEVYVRRLRRKVDRPFGRTSIEMVRGVGYRINGGAGQR